jgi:hypothetical protein
VIVSSVGHEYPGAVIPWNRRLLLIFAPVLILTGIGGFLIPPRLALMSGAAPYNIFHIVAGFVGLGAWWWGSRPAAGFNLMFGLVDLWLAVAGMTGWFPSALFQLRPADHLVHVLVGLLLVVVGGRTIHTHVSREGHTGI